MNGKHWGEIPNPISEIKPEVHDVKYEIEKAMDKCSLSELISANTLTANVPNPITFPTPDPLVMYAISLHKYMNQMTDSISSSIASNIIPSEDTMPPMPNLPKVLIKHKQNCLNFMPEKHTDFTTGKDVEIPTLSEEIVRKVLRKSICILLGQIGYELTHESLLNILIDVVLEFYRIFCSKLRIAMYDEEQHNSSGFPNVAERVLFDLGMGGVKGLHDYYQARVIKYVNVLYNRSNEMKHSYLSLSTAKEIMSIQMEVEDTEDNPEVHLQDNQMALPSLMPGLELLDTLESGSCWSNECND